MGGRRHSWETGGGVRLWWREVSTAFARCRNLLDLSTYLYSLHLLPLLTNFIEYQVLHAPYPSWIIKNRGKKLAIVTSITNSSRNPRLNSKRPRIPSHQAVRPSTADHHHVWIDDTVHTGYYLPLVSFSVFFTPRVHCLGHTSHYAGAYSRQYEHYDWPRAVTGPTLPNGGWWNQYR